MEGLSDLMEALSDLLKTLNDLLQAPSDLLVSFFWQRPQRGQSPVEYKGNLYVPSIRPSIHPSIRPSVQEAWISLLGSWEGGRDG